MYSLDAIVLFISIAVVTLQYQEGMGWCMVMTDLTDR